MWLYSNQIENDTARKHEREYLEKKILKLQEDIHQLEKSRGGGLLTDTDLKMKLTAGSSRNNLVLPNMKATVDQVSFPGCLVLCVSFGTCF